MLLCQETSQETVQDNIGVNTVRPLAGPSGLYTQTTVIVIVVVIVIELESDISARHPKNRRRQPAYSTYLKIFPVD